MSQHHRATTKLARTALALAALTLPLHAETATADCDGWTMTATKMVNPDGMRRYITIEATLLLEQDGEWVPVQTRLHDCLSEVTQSILVEDDWDAPLDDGNYRAVFDQDVWLGWWTELDAARETAAETAPWFGFEDEVGPFLCESECAGTGERHDYRFWRCNPDLWPVDELEFAGEVYSKEFLVDYLYSWGCHFRKKATKELIAAKLNLSNCSDADTVTNFPHCGATITDTVDYFEGYLFEHNYGGVGAWHRYYGYVKMAFYNRGWL